MFVPLLVRTDMPLPTYAARVRRFSIIDFIIASFYGWNASRINFLPIGLVAMSSILLFFWLLCGIGILYVTHPSRVPIMSSTVLHGNTALNVCTFLINVAYTITLKILLPRNDITIFCLTILMGLIKIGRIVVVHKFAMRVITEGASAFVKVNNDIIEGFE